MIAGVDGVDTYQAQLTFAMARHVAVDLAQVFKTYHLPHTGKLSLSRIWRGPISEGMVLNGTRVAGVVHLLGGQHEKVAAAQTGEVVGLTRMEEIATGAVLTP